MKLSLVVLTEGKQKGKALPISLAQFLVGRDPQCQLRPASALISKRHCAVLQRDGKAFIRDYDSTNGTFVNDEAVKGERELRDGDKLKIGPLEFTVKLEGGTTVDRPTPMPPLKAPTPPPLGKAPAVKAGDASDDEIAAMLLGTDDASGAASDPEVPQGSTVLDLAALQKAQGEAAPTDPAKKDAKKPSSGGDTRSAADAILKKYMRRPRT